MCVAVGRGSTPDLQSVIRMHPQKEVDCSSLVSNFAVQGLQRRRDLHYNRTSEKDKGRLAMAVIALLQKRPTGLP